MLSLSPLPTALRHPAALHGASAFTTIRTRRGQPLLWPQHLARLSATATLLGLPVPHGTEPPKLEPLPWGLLRLTLTESGLYWSHAALDAGPKPLAGVSVALTSWQVHPQLAAHKTGNYLPYRLAGAGAQAAGAFEGWLRLGDTLADGSRTAPLLELGGELVVPAGGLPSVTRAHHLAGKTFTERPVALAELPHISRVWICGSGVGVIPVRELRLEDGKRVELEAQWPPEVDAVTGWPG
ncbi:aminotransferase class IV [Deinococcus proteolyticus MRP]|uniref:Aminotransferase class IV n=1 Tax=Deinococcus proteolyticus (strain ATCC 35074 / DSM 20540 / JCM 6276 / NBRC 101906 / NCIMB 13154 / VKM Ac-1939 / CCM 2703 / MRP) TaxID=693977 RepID=F0RJC6_DEIPM|nr:aminotransferase class IV [Deinococcus proteolyticus]ADY25467.1 aminotransferase class IV [Deinococcus proteolyticus MRP]